VDGVGKVNAGTEVGRRQAVRREAAGREGAAADRRQGSEAAGQAFLSLCTYYGLSDIDVNLRQNMHEYRIPPFLAPFSLTQKVRHPHQNGKHGGMMVGVARYFA
jgi:hypothetical protein